MMEGWQQSCIEKNLKTLVQNTKCTQNLKAALREMELISEEEDESLTKLGEYKTSFHEAKEMYGILKTRHNGYEGLMEALFAENQTGAWNILKEGHDRNGPTEIFKNRLLKMKIQTLSGTKLLEQFFPNFSSDDMSKLWKDYTLSRELRDIYSHQNGTLKLDRKLPQSRSLYLPRSISNRLFVKSKVFQMQCRDIFVFKNMHRLDIVRIVGDNVIRSSSSQQSLIECRHIHLDDDEDWDDLILVAEAPIHLITKEDDNFVLERSKTVTDTIRNNSTKNGRHEWAYISEDDFIEQFISDFKGALLCDIPGIGKTWLMESLARKLGMRQEKMVVFYVQLLKFSTYLAEIERLPQKTDTLRFVLNYVNNSNFVVFLLSQHAENNDVKIVFLFDGFDEVSKPHVEKTTSLLEDLNTKGNVRLVISSRPSMRKHLEERLDLISYDILPFTSAEQVIAIVGNWLEKFPNCDKQYFNELANDCVNSMRGIQKKDSCNFLGVPLRSYMLAKVNEKHAEQLATPNRQKKLKMSDKALIKSVYDLYETFIDASFIEEKKKEEMMVFHTFKALQLLIPEISADYKAAKSLHAFPSDERIARVGILSRSDQDNYDFVHKTFADFFIAKFYATFWNKTYLYQPEFVWKVASSFVKKLLTVTVSKYFFSDFFDGINFNSGFSSHILLNYKICEFDNGTVLWFMENKFRTFTTSEEPSVKLQCFKHSLSHSMLESFKEVLAENVHVLLISCSEENFTSMMCFYVSILKMVFAPSEIPNLLSLPGHYLGHTNTRKVKNPDYVSRASVPFLLARAASCGNPEAVHQVRKLLISTDDERLNPYFSGEYPLDFYSPIDISIARNDVDMFMNFFNKVKLPRQRLFLLCLLGSKLSEEDKNARKKIFQDIIQSDQNKSMVESLFQSFEQYIASLNDDENNLNALIKFAMKHQIRLNHLPRFYKRNLLSHVCGVYDDEVFVTLVLYMFENVDRETRDLEVTTTKSSSSISIMDSSLVISSLDITETKKVFSKITTASWYAFQYMKNPNTWHILIAICPNLALCNERRRNYLHCAVRQGKVDWAEFLILNGCYIEEKDIDGNTPLLCITTRHSVELTRLPIKYNVDMSAVNNFEENVVHRIFRNVELGKIGDLYEWVSYMHDADYRRLWQMKDKRGNTPFEGLSQQAIKDMFHESKYLDDPKTLLFLFNSEFHMNIGEHLNIKNFDAGVLLKYVFHDKMSLSNLDNLEKRLLLQKAISLAHDKGLITTLQLLFPNYGAIPNYTACESIIERLSDSTDISIEYLGVDKLMQFIDLRNVNKALTHIKDAFGNLERTETLSLFISISPNFKICNDDEQNYMHYAVKNGNTEWMRYLVDSGYDVNERDKRGNAPLLLLSPKDPVKVTRALLELDADVFAVNLVQQNVAFRLIERCDSKLLDNVKEWVTFTLEKGYSKLWTMKGEYLSELKTPLELLANLAGEENALVKAIRATVQAEVTNQ